MFLAHVLIIRRSKLHYTASGIITPIGGRLVHRLREEGSIIRELYTVLSQPVHETATYRCDDTRGCVKQFWPPDDEHMCSKHVEAWNKPIVKQKKNCASSWLITEINILRCTVSKTSKFTSTYFDHVSSSKHTISSTLDNRLKHYIIQQMPIYIIHRYN